jgi:hypothetical protein
LLVLAAPKTDCDGAHVKSLRATIGKTAEAVRTAEAARGVSTFCEKELGRQNYEALFNVAGATPETKTTVISAALFSASSFASASCPSFRKAYADLGAVAPAEKARSLYLRCQLDRLDLFTLEEYDIVWKKDFGSALFAPPLYKWLITHNIEPADAKALVRTMLGL